MRDLLSGLGECCYVVVANLAIVYIVVVPSLVGGCAVAPGKSESQEAVWLLYVVAS